MRESDVCVRYTWRPHWLLKIAVTATMATTALLAASGLVAAIQDFHEKASGHALLSEHARSFGDWTGRALTIGDRDVVEDARLLIPESAAYRVVIGRGWTSITHTKWTPSIERDFLAYYLLPRRQVAPQDRARWVFCFRCDTSSIGRAVRIRARGVHGLLLLEVTG